MKTTRWFDASKIDPPKAELPVRPGIYQTSADAQEPVCYRRWVDTGKVKGWSACCDTLAEAARTLKTRVCASPSCGPNFWRGLTKKAA